MIISRETIEKLLALKQTPLTPEEMASGLTVTFFPVEKSSDSEMAFRQKLEHEFVECGVKVIPFEEALFRPSFSRTLKLLSRIILFNLSIVAGKLFGFGDETIKQLDLPFFIRMGKKIRKGIVVVAAGEGKTGRLPMDMTVSFKENPVLTIIDQPAEITEQSGYKDHMETALKLFAWHMTNLVITVSKDRWTIYSFNGSYPSYDFGGNMRDGVLNNLIPKLAAPVTPPRLSDFAIKEGAFKVADGFYADFVHDLTVGGTLLERTGLYPERRNIKDLNFRNNFYRWVGSIHLDKRSGMSYGFVARQLPTEISELIPEADFFAKNDRSSFAAITNDLLSKDGTYYLVLSIMKEKLVMPLPIVFVLTSKSGADKSKLDPSKDIIKMGLLNGEMILETPPGADIANDYKPSFDTKVILAHALGNAIIAAALKHYRPGNDYSAKLSDKGFALAHWHGFMEPEDAPEGWHVHGDNNYPVSCSSPQSGVYALRGKMGILEECLGKKSEYNGDIQIEPHHGLNFNYPTLEGLADYLLKNKDKYKLGE
ncbi:hypothetical protein HGA64_00065 [Candidatus Falkowbacteria bacterium]|nr:hypothetical protein [Candidatus Falkowbacteria bacterium]